MKIRATKANPGRIKIKGPGVNLWVEPFGNDGKPGKWIEVPDNVPQVDAIVNKFRDGGHIEVQGFVKMRSPVITQCAGDPRCQDEIVDKTLNMCYHHAMKLYRAEERARTDETVALAVSEITKARDLAEKENDKSKKTVSASNSRAKKTVKKKVAKPKE